MKQNETPQYRLMQPGEEKAVSNLVVRVFDEFVSPLYSQQGTREFLNYAHPGLLLRRSRKNHFVLVAVMQDEIVGMTEVRDNNHVCLLFVDKRFQRRGISRELLESALEICVMRQPGLSEITVNSSPNSVQVYERLGFRKINAEQVINGIRFTPMVFKLSQR